jgi:hypothetical protein
MKNKTIVFLLVVSLLALPTVALAAKAEPAGAGDISFTLGGFIKMEMWWDSAATTKNIGSPPLRNNHPNGQHGRFNGTAQGSRFNFTIKGPELWGAVTTGYLEMDFDKDFEARQSASHAYAPRLRHAFFRMNWPETEVLLGQYWSMFCEFYPELIQDGPFQGHGVATHRLAQARVTQLFGVGPGKLRLAALVGKPTDTADSGDVNYPIPTSNSALEGQTSETPQLQGLIEWQGDLWGKAGFYGRPRPFTAQVVGGWQRSRYRSFLDEDAVLIDGVLFDVTQRNQQYLNNWKVQGTLFIPVIPTATENLAGTSALTVQAYVGRGLAAFGNNTGFNSYFSLVRGLDDPPDTLVLDRKLAKTWGGYVYGNYYFSNQWWVAAAAGLGSNFGIIANDARNLSTANDVHNWWETDIALFYRPITAFKFGVGYAYTRANYYNQVDSVNHGELHSVRFAGWFFF